jgi:hypothetical protein
MVVRNHVLCHVEIDDLIVQYYLLSTSNKICLNLVIAFVNNELVWYEPIIITLFLIIPHDITDILLKVALSIIIITLLLIILI